MKTIVEHVHFVQTIPTLILHLYVIGHGSASKNPGIFNQNSYSKKIRLDNRYDMADPRPDGLKRTSGDEINHFIIKDMSKDRGSDKNGIPIKSNWSSMKPLYEEYVVTLERKLELIQLQGQFLENLKKDILSYDGDSLSNITAIHITGTENQV